jgi:hypothetical protein
MGLLPTDALSTVVASDEEKPSADKKLWTKLAPSFDTLPCPFPWSSHPQFIVDNPRSLHQPLSEHLTHAQADQAEAQRVKERLYGDNPAYASVDPLRFAVVVAKDGNVSRYQPGAQQSPRPIWYPVQDVWNKERGFPVRDMWATPNHYYDRYSKASWCALMECMEEAVRQGGLTPNDFRAACRTRWCLQMQDRYSHDPWSSRDPKVRNSAPRHPNRAPKHDHHVWECDGQTFVHPSSAVMHLEDVGGKGLGFFQSCAVRVVPEQFESQRPYRKGDSQRTEQLHNFVKTTLDRNGGPGTWASHAFWKEVDVQVERGADPSEVPLRDWSDPISLQFTLSFLANDCLATVATYMGRWIQQGWMGMNKTTLTVALLCGCDLHVWSPYLEECYRQGHLPYFAPLVYRKRHRDGDPARLAVLFQQLKAFVACGFFGCSHKVIANELNLPEAQVDALAIDVVNDVRTMLVAVFPDHVVDTILLDYILLNEPPLVPV